MIRHVGGLRQPPIFWLTMIALVLDGFAASWAAVLEDRMARESDDGRLAELDRLHDSLVDATLSGVLALADIALFLAAYLSFRRAITILGPSLLLRARTREGEKSGEPARPAANLPEYELDPGRAHIPRRPATTVAGADAAQQHFSTERHTSVNPHHQLRNATRSYTLSEHSTTDPKGGSARLATNRLAFSAVFFGDALRQNGVSV
ncbi:hypothetical protein DFJ73DRAFT_781808 [Zopfochytrium polystomum]|nr:hypothetical protein DFJ73DRAFT_781808 [Zopfochytrium polystomum]